MSNGRNYIRRGISYLKRNGISKTINKGLERLAADKMQKGYAPSQADEGELLAQRGKRFQNPYKFSILVPVYETDPDLFGKMLESVIGQTYGNWELIITDASRDDSRRSVVRSVSEECNVLERDNFGSVFDKIRYFYLKENKGISENTNEALAKATGDYVCLLDHDDLLEKSALFDIMTSIEATESKARSSESLAKVFVAYSDEDKVSEDGARYFDVNHKPDFDPVLLRTNNYICHFLVADTNLAKSVGGFRSEYDGAQDHDFILRCTEGLRREQIIHIPKVLYHWRSTEGSTAENPDAKLYAYRAGARAVQSAFKRAGIDAKITDSPHLGFFDIEYARLHRPVLSLPLDDFNAMTKENRQELDCEYIMILSSDLTPVDGEYIADMESCMRLPYVGAVTGKIIGCDRKVESAGYNIGEDGKRTARFAGLKASFSGYMHRASLHQLVDGFTQDCVLIRKDAVDHMYPEIVLKSEYYTYYNPKAVFKRKKK